MAVPEHYPQMMALASFYCFQRDLSFLFSLINTLIFITFQFIKLQLLFCKILVLDWRTLEKVYPGSATTALYSFCDKL